MRNTVPGHFDIQRLVLVCVGLLLLAGCRTPDWTKN